MNRDNEEQKAVSQTLCGALQKEANCKCLVLSVLIYGCLAAVTWCRCANVTKVVINFMKIPIRSTKNVSPCDDGYIYIPVAFMGMLYLVYLVECYHSPIRIDLLHAEGQSSVLAKLTQLKIAQPTIWWKAISYHYVRRKRQITRYRNGDNYTTTQVYYERVNTHAATSFYFYDYCGVKDISKELILDPKVPITKITLTKGFAFSNVRSATEFEEARSRFFAEQEFRDDYMEMRESLDLGYNFNPITLVAVLGNPWFTNSYVYWCLSALLLSWPLRIIIEYKTQYADYQITKLFGVNYDTPMTSQIHASSSQISAPGSYMLAPSYSEALLMEPVISRTEETSERENLIEAFESDMVPSYSEALLYERAQQNSLQTDINIQYHQIQSSEPCECPCHIGELERPNELDPEASTSKMENNNNNPRDERIQIENTIQTRSETINFRESETSTAIYQTRNRLSDCNYTTQLKICSDCLRSSASDPNRLNRDLSEIGCSRFLSQLRRTNSRESSLELLNAAAACANTTRNFNRDISEPDLRKNSELVDPTLKFLLANGRSLENILENEESDVLKKRAMSERAEALILEDQIDSISTVTHEEMISRGAIPKKLSNKSRVTVNPISEVVKRIPTSKTYFCLKSILKNKQRRYTMVTPEEFQALDPDKSSGEIEFCRNRETILHLTDVSAQCRCSNCDNDNVNGVNRESDDFSRENCSLKSENSRTLIFANPIQKICPSDPFQGKNVVQSDNTANNEDFSNLPVLSRFRRSLTEREVSASSSRSQWTQHRTISTGPDEIFSERHDPAISLPSYDGMTIPPDSRINLPNNDILSINNCPSLSQEDQASQNQFGSDDQSSSQFNIERPRLTRSLTERRVKSDQRKRDPILRNSFTDRIDYSFKGSDGKRTNLNMETSL
ncbi:transmembrane protein 151 homolog [Leptopilina boulardi]|uniref:transmembrane protein 151 homolog n=1 Tax=Leptopilina boulardi TaxID=63433 RepID=UPI0021F535F1|nr:transmembrane protein 151 homolog [Leptopilina boulardi]